MPDAALPPQAVEVEKAVLGACMMSQSAVRHASEHIHHSDAFYYGQHAPIWEAIRRLDARADPIDQLTVSSELQRANQLEAAGGVIYLADLAAGVASSANVSMHAKIVAGKYLLRRIMSIGQRLFVEASGEKEAPEKIVSWASETLYGLLDSGSGGGFRAVEEVMQDVIAAIETAATSPGGLTGVDTGIHELNELTGGWQNSDLIIVAARPGVGKSALATEMGRHAAMSAGMPVGIFNLEMSDVQVGQRLLASYSRVDLQRIRSGRLSADEFTTLTFGSGRIASSPIYIDDSPGLPIDEIRFRARELKRRRGIGMFIVDYLQLASASERNSSREQEVARISRGLKGMAKELHVPVIALSQLSRAPETRADRRPMLSDLRECVAAGTEVLLASGACVPVECIKEGTHVVGINDGQKMEVGLVVSAGPSGAKECYAILTQGGRQVTASGDHRFFSDSGRWTTVDQLHIGDRIAVPFRVPAIGTCSTGDASLCRLLGYLVGNGTYLKHREVGLCMGERETFDDAVAIIAAAFPTVSVRIKTETPNYVDGTFPCIYANGYGKPHGNPLREWLREISMHGSKDCHKRVPEWVFERGIVGASEFLAGYFASDGCVKVSKAKSMMTVHCDTTSRGLTADITRLLAVVGVGAVVGAPAWNRKSTRPIWRLTLLNSNDNLSRFASSVPLRGKRARVLASRQKAACSGSDGYFGLPTFLSQSLAIRSAWKHQGKRMKRATAMEWAAKDGDRELLMWASSDVMWDPIVSKVPVGPLPTYDLAVAGLNSFVANGIVTHNSGGIEADADVVMFIYRPEIYGKIGDPTEGIVAKQRNGPLGTVLLDFDAPTATFRGRNTT